MDLELDQGDGALRAGGLLAGHEENLMTTHELDPFTVPVVAESAEAVIDNLDAPLVAAPMLLDGIEATNGELGRGTVAGHRVAQRRVISVDEYAKAVLYNGLGHYRAARAAAHLACENDDFALLEGALVELVESGVRCGCREDAALAAQRLEARAEASGTEWARGVAACAQALLSEDESAEARYLEAIERLGRTRARVSRGRVQLLYGEWLRRRGRRVDARRQLNGALLTFGHVGLNGFAERTRRELLATCQSVRKRTDDTRNDLTDHEAQIAQLAADGYTNPEIGRRLFISPRTVEWHLRNVFTKLDVSSRRELRAFFPVAAQIVVSPG